MEPASAHNLWMLMAAKTPIGGGGGANGYPCLFLTLIGEVSSATMQLQRRLRALAGESITMGSQNPEHALFHGTLWEFNRNDIFDAEQNYSANMPDRLKPIPKLRQNLFGAMLRTVFIPHFTTLNAKKTFSS